MYNETEKPKLLTEDIKFHVADERLALISDKNFIIFFFTKNGCS